MTIFPAKIVNFFNVLKNFTVNFFNALKNLPIFNHFMSGITIIKVGSKKSNIKAW
ncbi:MAG TPA: hypothetical protein PLP27_00205 [Crocinitomicaceae bacterium]|nr:hypothetical protein [Crocinitomicaceae bacterium]